MDDDLVHLERRGRSCQAKGRALGKFSVMTEGNDRSITHPGRAFVCVMGDGLSPAFPNGRRRPGVGHILPGTLRVVPDRPLWELMLGFRDHGAERPCSVPGGGSRFGAWDADLGN